MKAAIAPSVLSFNHAEIRPRVAELVAGGMEVLHLDIMDGQFVPPITFGAGLADGLKDLAIPMMEAHLMTLTPEVHFKPFADAGCRRIIFHAEATAHAHRLIQTLRAMDVEPGIAINPATPASAVREVVDMVDLVLVMTVNPGWGGQAFIPRALDKVREIRSWRSDVHIQVDGGIDFDTLPSARQAGANLFVVGSHLLKYPSLAEAMRVLTDRCA